MSAKNGAVKLVAGNANPMLAREIACKTRHQTLRFSRILLHTLDDRRDVDMSVVVVPAVIIGHHRHARVANLGFARELCFRHVRHADHVAIP